MMRAGASLTENRFFNNCGGKLFAKTGPILLDSNSYSITPTVISLTGACGLRILWIYTVFALDRSLFTLYLSYPVTWAVTFLGHLVCFFIFLRKVKRKAAWEIRPQGPEPGVKEERAEEIYNQRETNEEL